MVRIDSVTPWLIPGGAGEGEVARYMRDWFTDLGLEVTLEEVEPGRPNVLAWLRGSAPGPTLCLTAHSDTVGYAGWPDRALNPVIEGDRMIGLGVADDKGGCAAAMLAARELVRSGAQLAGNRAGRAARSMRRGSASAPSTWSPTTPTRSNGDRSGARRAAAGDRRSIRASAGSTSSCTACLRTGRRPRRVSTRSCTWPR